MAGAAVRPVARRETQTRVQTENVTEMLALVPSVNTYVVAFPSRATRRRDPRTCGHAAPTRRTTPGHPPTTYEVSMLRQVWKALPTTGGPGPVTDTAEEKP